MTYDVYQHLTYTVIVLSGEVDLHRSPEARELILMHLSDRRDIAVDLSAVTYMDSSGVASLVEGYQLARSMALGFALVAVSDPAMRVLRLARLDRVFPIHDSVAALQSRG